jgi:hypothetical protein
MHETLPLIMNKFYSIPFFREIYNGLIKLDLKKYLHYYLRNMLLWQTEDSSTVRSISSLQHVGFIIYLLKQNSISNLFSFVVIAEIFGSLSHFISAFRSVRVVCVKTTVGSPIDARRKELLISIYRTV